MTVRRRSALRIVEDDTRRLLSSAAYAEQHPSTAGHLDEAFGLLSSEKLDPETTAAVANHLRNALLTAINDIVGEPPPGEDHPMLRLRDHVATLGLAVREAKVATAVVDLARAALRLDHRLGFIRDAEAHGEPGVVFDEVRRAAFATAFACYELARLQDRFD
jgi:hypothetical protein